MLIIIMSEENKSNNDWSAREIGAMWKKDGQNQKYLSGKIKLPGNLGGHELGVVMFTNRQKSADNQPDFRLYLDSRSVSTDDLEAEKQTEVVEDVL